MTKQKIEIIKKNIHGFKGNAWLLKRDKRYFVASGVYVPFSGWEVLVFKSNKKGEIRNWSEICGGRGITHEEAIKELEAI